MTRHHPDDALLLGLAAGTLDRASALVVAAHVELCASCSETLAMLEAAGGALLDRMEPAEMAADSFSRTLALIHGGPAASAKPAAASRARPPLPPGMKWPKSLDACEISPWKTIGPGMRWSRIRVPGEPEANAFLLRMGAGKELAAHSHGGRELTQILYGAFSDGRAVWTAGDLDETDESVHHKPVVMPESECICLVAVQGRIRFESFIARALGAWMRI